jgi:uncharacterized membrane protein
MSPIALALSYWLHMVATIVWIGGLAMLALVAWPGAQKVLGGGPQLAALAADWQRRFNPLAWLSLAALVVTGLIQMSANENYDGLLVITNGWTAAILAKHVAVGGMMLIGAYMNLSLYPALARVAILQARGQQPDQADALRLRELALNRLNLAFGLVVLALTALARALSG